MDKVSFSENAWDEYLDWQAEDRKTLKKINALIKDIFRNGPLNGLGKPEALRGDLSGAYSREISKKDRLLYEITEEGTLFILSCKGHYGDK